MTTKIKYRAKASDTNEWVEGYYVKLAGFDYIVPFNQAFRYITDADIENSFVEIDVETLEVIDSQEENMTIAKRVIIEELERQWHPERVEDVIFWALEYYAESEPKGTWGRIISYAIKDRILREEEEDKMKKELDI